MMGRGLELVVHTWAAERRETGPRGAPARTVLLLHGFLDAGSTWGAVAAPLASAGFEVFAPDLRGFGESDRVPSGGYYHFPDYIADLDVLVPQLASPRLAIVGHSMGGTIAAFFAGARPKQVDKLALLEGMGPPAATPSDALTRMRAFLESVARAPAHRPMTLDDAVGRLTTNHPRVSRETLEQVATCLTRRRDDGSLEWSYDPLHRTTSPTPFLPAAFATFLDAIECETLVVSGGPAGWHPPDEVERLAALRQARGVEIPDAGHMMHWSRPAELAALLVDFLASGAD